MWEQIKEFLNNMINDITGKTNTSNKGKKNKPGSKAKERLHIVLVQDRANISTDFLELMKQEIIDVIKKYVVIDESKIDMRFTNSVNNDGTHSAPTLYANVPILNIRNEMKSHKLSEKEIKKQEELEEKVDEALKKEDQFETMKITIQEEKIKKDITNDLNKVIQETAKKEREKNKKEHANKTKGTVKKENKNK